MDEITPSNLAEQLEKSPEIMAEILDRQEVRQIIGQRIHAGPLPTPEDLVKYGESIENAGERMMRIVEKRLEMDAKEQQFRHKQHETEHKDVINLLKRGQNYGFYSTVLITLFSCFLVYMGYPKTAAFTMVSLVGVLAGIFVIGKYIKPEQNHANQTEN